MTGFLKLNRIKMKNFPYYKDAKVMHLFLHLLLSVNYEDKQWRDIMIHRGEMVTSMENLAESTGISKDTVRRILIKLETIGCVQRKTTNKYTVIKLLQFEDMQSFDALNNEYIAPKSATQIAKQMRTARTTNANQSQTTIENNKVIRKEYKRNNCFSSLGINLDFLDENYPKLTAIMDYCESRNSIVSPYKFFNYYQRQNWKDKDGNLISDWQGVLQSWERNIIKKNALANKDSLY